MDGPGTITLLEIRGDKVRLGFTAPETTTILRPDAVNKAPPAGRDVDPVCPLCGGARDYSEPPCQRCGT